MKIQEFIGAMLPNLEKSRVDEDIRNIRDRISNITLPAYENGAPLFKGKSFSSDFCKEIDKLAKRKVNRYDENYIATIHKALKLSDENLATVKGLIDNEFSNDIMRDGMDLVKEKLLQYVSMVKFMDDYARRLLMISYTLETNPNLRELSKSSSRDHKWLVKHQDSFMVCLNACLFKTDEVEEKFEEVPDIAITEQSVEIARKTAGISKTDPFMAGLIPYKLNPIYHVRMMYTQWQIKKYEEAKEEASVLELKLLQLQESRQGKADAKVDKAVDYHEGRLEKLRYKISKMEEGDD